MLLFVSLPLSDIRDILLVQREEYSCLHQGSRDRKQDKQGISKSQKEREGKGVNMQYSLQEKEEEMPLKESQTMNDLSKGL